MEKVSLSSLETKFATTAGLSKVGIVIFTIITVGCAALVAAKIAATVFLVIGTITALFALSCIIERCTAGCRFQSALKSNGLDGNYKLFNLIKNNNSKK